MTDFSHKQASEQIAKLYGVNAELWVVTKQSSWMETETSIRLITQDLGALMELAIRNGINVMPNPEKKLTVCSYGKSLKSFTVIEYDSQHNNDPIEATRVAIAKALIKKAGE